MLIGSALVSDGGTVDIDFSLMISDKSRESLMLPFVAMTVILYCPAICGVPSIVSSFKYRPLGREAIDQSIFLSMLSTSAESKLL